MINKGAVKKAFIKTNYCPVLCNCQEVRKFLLGGWCIHSEMPLKLLLCNYISWWHVLPVVAAMRDISSRMFFKLSFD